MLYNICLIVATIIANCLCFVNVIVANFEITGVNCGGNCRNVVDKMRIFVL